MRSAIVAGWHAEGLAEGRVVVHSVPSAALTLKRSPSGFDVQLRLQGRCLSPGGEAPTSPRYDADGGAASPAPTKNLAMSAIVVAIGVNTRPSSRSALLRSYL